MLAPFSSKWVAKACLLCGALHKRHTYATRTLEAGIHPKVVSEILGHASISITLDLYSHVLPDLKKEAASKLNHLFDNSTNIEEDEPEQIRAKNRSKY
ncbi:MAG: hypothetical protein A2Y21_03070 [Clostridiales bacterium GWC2_40_7]|nr:MAG: hypothetical protein A2Y21_03070 [Clostridiales bacterium GWC2_40_7]